MPYWFPKHSENAPLRETAIFKAFGAFDMSMKTAVLHSWITSELGFYPLKT